MVLDGACVTYGPNNCDSVFHSKYGAGAMPQDCSCVNAPASKHPTTSDDDVSDTEEEKPKSPLVSSISVVAVAPSFSKLPDASMLLNSPLLIGGYSSGGALDIGGLLGADVLKGYNRVRWKAIISYVQLSF
ncbi:hypothetical protein ACFE04_028804 [Oxalis oulophora]